MRGLRSANAATSWLGALALGTLVVVLSVVVPVDARADGLEPYQDPSYSAALQTLLKTTWPNQFSADEQAIGHSSIDQQIRDGLFRIRGAARTYARLVLASPLVRDGYKVPGEGERWGMGWKVRDAGGVKYFWSHLSDVPVPDSEWKNLEWGTPTLSGRLTDYRWSIMCRLGGGCPDVSTGFNGLPASPGNLGWWVLQYKYDGTWRTNLWPCTAPGWNPHNHYCNDRDVESWNSWGTPNAAQSPAQLKAATNDDGSPMDCDTTSAVEQCYFRVVDVATMATKIQQERFEEFSTQPYSTYFPFDQQPHSYDEAAARAEIAKPVNDSARQWINHELNSAYADPRAPKLAAPPGLVGLPFEAELISAMFAAWDPAASQRSFQWQRCDAFGGSCVDISGASSQAYTITADDVGHTLRVREIASNAYGTADAFSLPSSLVRSLVFRYAPELHYDSQETYRADSAAEMTDNYLPNSDPLYENVLRNDQAVVLAGAHPDGNHDRLTMDYLGADSPWSATHYLDAENDYAADAARLHADPAYKNRVYGRQRTTPNGTTILQYWLFYYYNPKSWLGIGAGAHEGDWEMIQVQINPSGDPTETVYSQHETAEVCDWAFIPKTDDDRPIVYVAEGSHANYYSSGSHEQAPGFIDTNDDFGGNVIPDVDPLDPEPPWLAWEGHWGSSDGPGISPQGPKFHGEQWSDPVTWAGAQGGCSLLTFLSAKSKSGARAPSHPARVASPPVPILSARIVNGKAVVDYGFTSLPRSQKRRPWQLISSVVSKGAMPVTVHTPAARRRGRIVQALGPGHPPYRLLVSVRSPNGSRSRVVRLSLR